MASNRWNVRLDQNDREMKLERIQARSGARNRAQALDTALNSYFQLERILNSRIDEIDEDLEFLDGEAIGLRFRISTE